MLLFKYKVRANGVVCKVYQSGGNVLFVKTSDGRYATAGPEDNLLAVIQELTDPHFLAEDAA